jgi:hypothetical protein
MRRAGLAADETRAFGGEKHLVHRRRRGAEAAPDVGFGGCPQVDACVVVDECDYCPWVGVKPGLCPPDFLMHPSIRLSASEDEAAMNICYRVSLPNTSVMNSGRF